MATIGQALTTPETGWRRYDDSDSRIKYVGTWTHNPNAGKYNGIESFSNVMGNYLSFKFYGSKLRIIDSYHYNRSNMIKISIDGIDYNYSAYSANTIVQALVFEKTGLDLGVHTAIITLNTNDSTYVALDAIDIDDTGYLMHPTLNQVSNVSGIKIGDCIPCRYTALTSGQPGYFSELGTCIANEIPVTGTATPDGLFYFICAGKDYLGRNKFIPDRNIQHSISWDTLNAAGICSEINPSTFNIIPSMTSNTAPSGTVSASIPNGSGSDPYQAFRLGGYGWYGTAGTGWLRYQFPNQRKICSYIITEDAASYTNTTNPKNWTFEGSNDGTNWDILDSQTNITWPSSGINKKAFNITNPKLYSQYRINVMATNGSNYISIMKLEMMEDFVDHSKYKPSMRLLTGGTSATDTDNEWDKIIVNSTLGGKITAGDDNIWHWSGQSYTMTSTVMSTTSTARVLRGTSSVNYSGGGTSSAFIAADGFRPVLLVETLNIYKYLLRKDSKYYNLKQESYDNTNNIFIPLTLEGNTIPNENDINNFGLNDLSQFTTQMTIGGNTFMPIDKFKDNFEVLLYYK